MEEACHYGGKMKTQELKSIIQQIKRYDLSNAFDSPEELDKWLESLNNRQINNIITLDLNPEELNIPAKVIININLSYKCVNPAQLFILEIAFSLFL